METPNPDAYIWIFLGFGSEPDVHALRFCSGGFNLALTCLLFCIEKGQFNEYADFQVGFGFGNLLLL